MRKMQFLYAKFIIINCIEYCCALQFSNLIINFGFQDQNKFIFDILFNLSANKIAIEVILLGLAC
jgi:hypothetical protein